MGAPSLGSSRNSRAGITPAKPHDSDMSPTVSAMVWIKTVSSRLNDERSRGEAALKNAKPIRAEAMDMSLPQPDCRMK